MLESLFGSVNRERVLIYLLARDEGYAREMARFYQTDLLGIQKQLAKLEEGGVLDSRQAGQDRQDGYTKGTRFCHERPPDTMSNVI